MKAVLCVIFLIYFSVHEAHGLTCYSCNSKSDNACKYGLASFIDSTQECASAGVSGATHGAKCYTISAETKNGEEHIARGCLTPESSINCEAIASTIGWVSSETGDNMDSLKTFSCGICEGNVCNSAQRFTGVTFVGVILAAVVFMF